MRNFFKSFFASLLAIVVFCFLLFVIFIVIASSANNKPAVGSNGVLVVDLSTIFKEQVQQKSLGSLFGNKSNDIPGLYDMVRMIHFAKTDSSIKGIYIKAEENNNGLATSEELRNAIADFKRTGKFVIAYGDQIPQRAYSVACAANKVYCNPAGGVEWDGFSYTATFFKGLLDKLEIEPQVFYAGKFKSATEPFRVTSMTDANRLQSSVFLNDFYSHFLMQVSATRNIDTAALHNLASTGAIQTANDALKYKLVDGLKYDDDVKTEILQKLGKSGKGSINFISAGKYAQAVNFKNTDGNDKIAIIYAQGDIVGGKGDEDQVGSETYVKRLREARLDDDVKAIVLRVNSPGGSALASEEIWREVTMAKKEKPVVLSMGDYAASGGYYIACNADSIFADKTTITGSIGVFSIIPNMQNAFKNKLGITFDGVKTAPYADAGSVSRPLSEQEKKFFQASVDTIYYRFKTRVANGRKKSVDYIDSIAQGRVWTGNAGIGVGIVDRIGTLQDAINCAARMARLSSYRTREYPEPPSLINRLMNSDVNASAKASAVKEELGDNGYSFLMQLKKLESMIGSIQTRLPCNIEVR